MPQSIHKLRHIVLLLTIFSTAVPLMGQQSRFYRDQKKMFSKQLRSNLTVKLGTGIANLHINSDLDGVNRLGFTTQLTAGYTFLWAKEMGFHTGLGIVYAGSGFSTSKVEAQSMGYMTAYNNEDATTRSTHYTASVSSVKESYQAFFLELPIQLTFQNEWFWVDYGFKLLLPLSVKASCTYGATSIGAGYQIDGFGTRVDIPVEIARFSPDKSTYTVSSLVGGGVCYPAYIAFAISGGYRLALDNKQMLQFGFYFDIALNRTPVGSDNSLVVFGDVPSLRPILQSNLVNSLRYINFGVSITYNYTFGKRIGYHKGNPFTAAKGRRKGSLPVKW